jgi:hypothetical protein
MLNTLKTLPKSVMNHPVSVTLQEAAFNVLSANINVLNVTRDEGRKVYGVVKEKADVLAAENLALLKTTVEAANDKVNQTWSTVEGVLEARVLPMLDKLGLAAPAQFGVELVGKGLGKVSAQVVELTRVPAPLRAARKPAARKAAAKKPISRATRKAA